MEDSWNSEDERNFIRLEAKRRARAARTAATVSICKQSKNTEEDEQEKSQDDFSSSTSHGLFSYGDLTDLCDESEEGHKKMSLFEKALLTNKAVKKEFKELKLESANKIINDELNHLDLAKIHAPFLLFIRWFSSSKQVKNIDFFSQF